MSDERNSWTVALLCVLALIGWTAAVILWWQW